MDGSSFNETDTVIFVGLDAGLLLDAVSGMVGLEGWLPLPPGVELDGLVFAIEAVYVPVGRFACVEIDRLLEVLG